MPRTKRVLASDLTVADLKRMLAAKELIAPLEEKKAKLEAELAAVNGQLAKLGASGKPAAKRGRKPGRPAAKKVGRRVAKKTPVKRPGGIQDVVVGLIRANGKPMEFKAILAAIKKGKLVKTKSKNFENVLRRTLSTSTAVKRVVRGVYGVKGRH